MLKKVYSKTNQVCKVTFSLPIDATYGGQDIRVVGEFNNWNWEEGLAMVKGKTEYTATLELPAGRNYEFRYLVDNGHWENDWAADAYVPSPFDGIDNSVLSVSALENGVPVAESNGSARAKSGAKKAKEEVVAAEAPAKPKKATKPAKSDKDDLKKIEGVGPKIETLLNEAGILTFTDLSKASAAKVKGILEAAGSRYKLHDPTTWAKQAKLAANGDWDTLAKLQDELKGGK